MDIRAIASGAWTRRKALAGMWAVTGQAAFGGTSAANPAPRIDHFCALVKDYKPDGRALEPVASGSKPAIERLCFRIAGFDTAETPGGNNLNPRSHAPHPRPEWLHC